jgi:hypothetical protein
VYLTTSLDQEGIKKAVQRVLGRVPSSSRCDLLPRLILSPNSSPSYLLFYAFFKWMLRIFGIYSKFMNFVWILLFLL